MKVVEFTHKKLPIVEKPISICLGYFDGLHLGHISLINQARKNSELPIGILTFDRPISSLIKNNKSKEVLTSKMDKRRIINQYSLDYFFVMKIDREFINLSALEFIEILKKINVKEIYVGDDYKFAKNRSGDVSLLKKYFNVHVVNMMKMDDKKISSQDIIEYIHNGDIVHANDLLGRAYEMHGHIARGQGIGKSLGFPTANTSVDADYVIPKFGVYKTLIFISGVPHLSITNVGINPTIDNKKHLTIETHIPNYEGEDYDKEVYLAFLDFLRPEIKFNNLDELIKQINQDIESITK